MFSRTVDSLEGFLVQKAGHAVLLRDLLHEFHRQLIIVHGNIRGIEDGRKLVLGGRDFVMFGFCENAVRPQRFVEVVHELGNAGFEDAEIVIFELLSPRRGRAEQRSARQNEIFSLFIHFLVDKEIFLFGADRRGDLFAVDSEQFQNAFARAVERGHGFEQRRLFVERFSRIGNKDGGDIERSLFDERGRSGIPGGIAAGGAGSSRTARRERRSVGFSDDQGFPRELHDDAVAATGFYKAVVLFRC